MTAKLVLNVDTGVDDALGILLAVLCPSVEVLGITASAGNVNVRQVAYNTRFVLDLAGRPNVPVIAGASKPLKGRLLTATLFSGQDGLAGQSGIAPQDFEIRDDVVSFLRHAAETYGDDLIVVSTAPLTNLALVLADDPLWGRKIGGIVEMGGAATVPGNVTPSAEFNIICDPEAAKAVFESGANIVMVGLDVTRKAVITRQQLDRWGQSVRNLGATNANVPAFALKLLDYSMRAELNRQSAQMYDPLAVAAAIDPGLLLTKPMRVEVETRGEFTRGQTVANVAGSLPKHELSGDAIDIIGFEPVEPNVNVALDVDAQRFTDMFVEHILGIEA